MARDKSKHAPSLRGDEQPRRPEGEHPQRLDSGQDFTRQHVDELEHANEFGHPTEPEHGSEQSGEHTHADEFEHIDALNSSDVDTLAQADLTIAGDAVSQALSTDEVNGELSAELSGESTDQLTTDEPQATNVGSERVFELAVLPPDSWVFPKVGIRTPRSGVEEAQAFFDFSRRYAELLGQQHPSVEVPNELAEDRPAPPAGPVASVLAAERAAARSQPPEVNSPSEKETQGTHSGQEAVSVRSLSEVGSLSEADSLTEQGSHSERKALRTERPPLKQSSPAEENSSAEHRSPPQSSVRKSTSHESRSSELGSRPSSSSETSGRSRRASSRETSRPSPGKTRQKIR